MSCTRYSVTRRSYWRLQKGDCKKSETQPLFSYCCCCCWPSYHLSHYWRCGTQISAISCLRAQSVCSQVWLSDQLIIVVIHRVSRYCHLQMVIRILPTVQWYWVHLFTLPLSASRAEDPGFESRLHQDFFGVESYQWFQNWHSSGYPARRLAWQGQHWDWSGRCQYAVTGWGGTLDLQLLSQSGSTYNCLCRSVPEILSPVAGTLSKQQQRITLRFSSYTVC